MTDSPPTTRLGMKGFYIEATPRCPDHPKAPIVQFRNTTGASEESWKCMTCGKKVQ